MKQHFQVNWVNGMKITSDHFLEMENHFIDRMQSSISGLVNPMNYGLVPGVAENTTSPRFTITLNKDRITILNGMIILTPEGHLIQIPENQTFPITSPAVHADWFFLVVSGRPYVRAPFGTISPNENPARYPYAMQDLRFEFFAQGPEHFHVLEANKVPVGRYNGLVYEEDKTYIPPCTSIVAHPELISLYKVFQESFSELERKVITLLKTKDHQNSPLLVRMLSFFAHHKPAIDNTVPYQPPFALFEKIQQFARIIHYFHKIQNKEVLSDIVDFKYNHFEIRKAVDVAYGFLKSYQQYLPFDARFRP